MDFSVFLALFLVPLVTEVCAVNAGSIAETPVVALAQGAVKGRVWTSLRGRQFFGYHGIPYAKAPVGELRFKDPEDPESWDGIRNAQNEPNTCPQRNLITRALEGEEDCLFINVYTSKIPDEDEPVKRDVLVWIHGGGFLVGTGNTDWYGPQHLLDEDVVLVTFQYRVGVLGFLSTQDSVLPGNYGLKDQVQALKWVQQNIAAFGGNPGSVTIFGESAGAASVHFLLLSPMSEGLFHRAISQSGSALSPWAFTDNARSRAFKVGELVGCESQNSEDLVRCLKKVDPVTLVKQTPRLREWSSEFFFPFNPVVETDVRAGEDLFLPAHPIALMKQGKFHKVPWIVGFNADEGLYLALQVLVQPKLSREIREDFDRIAPIFLEYERDTDKSREITRRIKEFYFKDKPIGQETFREFVELESDVRFVTGILKSVKLHLGNSSAPIYFYELSYQGRFGILASFGAKEMTGVAHGDDMMYLFRMPAFNLEITPNDPEIITVDRFVKMWTNFARNGNPTPEKNEILNVSWEPMTLDNPRYLDIGTELKMKTGLYEKRVEFWESMEELMQGSYKDEL